MIDQLRKYNRWRRGDARIKQPDPKALGVLIDAAADRLEALERENKELSEERRMRQRLVIAVERCYQMLLTEPNTSGALAAAETILHKALMEQTSTKGKR